MTVPPAMRCLAGRRPARAVPGPPAGTSRWMPVRGGPGRSTATGSWSAAALLAAFGVPDGSEAAARTPARMVAGLAELLSSPPWEFTTFPNREDHHELVMARDVPFTSVCAHHLLPFSGTAHVGVLPGARIAGLSKLARAVETFAARMQVQEELGQQIAAFLEEQLECHGVGVVLVAEHPCMMRRGVRAAGAGTITIASRGRLRDDPVTACARPPRRRRPREDRTASRAATATLSPRRAAGSPGRRGSGGSAPGC